MSAAFPNRLGAIHLGQAACLALTLAVGGCNTSPPAPAEAPSASAAAPAAPPAPEPVTPPVAAVDPASVPTEEDFEEQASQSISSKNLNQELDKLEHEISGT